MSDHTTRIVDLPENISIQMPPSNFGGGIMTISSAVQTPSLGIPSTNTRTEYDPQNPTYTPMNIHPNPYGNSIQPNVLPLPEPKYQQNGPPQQAMMRTMDGGSDMMYAGGGGMGGGVGGPMQDAMAELRNMAPVRLQSRDIPIDIAQYQQDEEIQPNYIPKPKLTRDYVRDYEEAAEKSAKKHEKAKRQAEQIEDAMTDFQLPVLVAVLFFLFQIPVVHSIMYRYLSFVPIFHTDGNLNFYGILLKSAMFGSAFWSLQRVIHMVS